jgi:hypothetical protein
MHTRDDRRQPYQVAGGIIFYLRADLGNLGANLVTQDDRIDVAGARTVEKHAVIRSADATTADTK